MGALVVAFGFGVAAMTFPGIVAAEPSAEPSPGASQVESPGSGDPGSKTEPEVVSSGGSTPPVGAGSVVAGPGSDESSGPGQASGSTASTIEPAPGVTVSSSGGATISSLYDQVVQGEGSSTTGGQAAQDQATPDDSWVATTPAAEQAVVPTPEVEPAAAPVPAAVVHDAAAARALAGDLPSKPNDVVVAAISAIPPAFVSVVGGATRTSFGSASRELAAVGERGTTEPPFVAARPGPTTPDDDTSPREPVGTFTGVLAAALAPFVLPMPGSPVDAPTFWAVLAWVRRQSERSVVGEWQTPVATPTHTVLVLADPAAPRAVVDRVDRTTGRIAGHVEFNGADGGDAPTYSLVGQLDRRLGAVTVDADSGQWAFTPSPAARLATHLDLGDGVATFAVATSDGRTVDVHAPVDPAETAVTGTIDVGTGLTYGMAVIGDRLYVLNGSDDAAGNGSVKVVDTSTRRVVGSVGVGSMPFALAASGATLYVGNADDGTVSVIDARTNTVVDVIDVGANPFGLEVTDDRLYVADLAGTVSVIDLADNTELVRIPVGGDPFGLAATADRVYVTNYAGGTVAVLDQTTNTADHADTAGYPYHAAVVGGRLYVVNVATNALTIVDRSTTTAVDVDPKTRALDAIPPEAAPVDMVVRGDRLYLSNIHCGTVTVVDVATNRVVENVGVGIQPGLMAASRDGRTVYVSDVMGGTVRVITSVRHAAPSTV
jgi:YVTN family beta-propeller protein